MGVDVEMLKRTRSRYMYFSTTRRTIYRKKIPIYTRDSQEIDIGACALQKRAYSRYPLALAEDLSPESDMPWPDIRSPLNIIHILYVLAKHRNSRHRQFN